ncbi:MAG: DUF1059 domain-containing protein [Solirubrobacteraceae bacterium]
MTLIINCPRCDKTITADDEEDLVAKVQAHVRKDHGFPHTLPRKHILGRLRSLPPSADPDG